MDIEKIKRGAKLLDEAHDLLRHGPLEYSLTQLVQAYDLLITRFAPFDIGERVKLAKTPKIERGSGWYGCRHFLKEGAIGEVKHINCVDGKFKFDVAFDDESWIDRDGIQHRAADKHTFYFGEDFLVACKSKAGELV